MLEILSLNIEHINKHMHISKDIVLLALKVVLEKLVLAATVPQ